MKRILQYVFIGVLLSAVSCKKDDTRVFSSSSDVRVQQVLESFQTTLVNASSGWLATISTVDGGGYGFWLQFDDQNRVKMASDFSLETAESIAESSYRLKALQQPTLLFDTYSYIHLLADPTGSVNGGNYGSGLVSDFEFYLTDSMLQQIKANPNDIQSLLLVGRYNETKLILKKATPKDKSFYTEGDYKTSIEKFLTFLSLNKNAYFELADGNESMKVGIAANTDNGKGGKKVTLTGLLSDGNVVSQSAKFAYTIDEMQFLDSSLTFQGITFTHFGWKDSKLAIFDDAGKAYEVKNSDVPVLPLYKLWGNKYSEMYSPFKVILPGTSASGAEILNFFHNNLENSYTGYKFNYGELDLVWNVESNELTLNGYSSQNGGSSGWITKGVYKYTVDNEGIYSFVLQDGFTGGYVEKILAKLNDFMLHNKIKFDYYMDGDDVLVQMVSVDDPSITMTFELY